MKSPPVETNSLPSDLAARFAALRSRPTAQRSEQPKDDLEARLKQLEPPTDTQVARSVPIEVNDQVSDESVEKFLQSLSTEQLESPSPMNFPPHDHNSSSSSSKQKIPALSQSSLDTLSGIEIEFIKRPPPESSSSIVVDSEEEDELLQRMRDELNVEERESSRNRIGVEKWEERINGLKGVVPLTTGGGGERIQTNPTLGDGPPELGELERELRRRKKREERRKKGKSGKNSTSEEEEDSSETETETETESSDEESDKEL